MYAYFKKLDYFSTGEQRWMMQTAQQRWILAGAAPALACAEGHHCLHIIASPVLSSAP
jgi:hypothetical protein